MLIAPFRFENRAAMRPCAILPGSSNMKTILATALATLIALLAGCVSAPSELYGIHQIPREEAAKPPVEDANKIAGKGTN